MEKCKKTIWAHFVSLFFLMTLWRQESKAQAPKPPTLVEAFFGNEALYFQLVVRKKFAPTSRLGFFTLASYSADYENHLAENAIVVPVQLSYELGKGFGIMGGTDINSNSGFAAIVGPQYNYVSKEFLAITVISFFLNKDNDVKLFGLYEYKPSFTENLGLYTRVQFVVNQSWRLGLNNQRYLYLRAGLQNKQLIYGLAANLEQAGPLKRKGENYGLFIRWEFD